MHPENALVAAITSHLREAKSDFYGTPPKLHLLNVQFKRYLYAFDPSLSVFYERKFRRTLVNCPVIHNYAAYLITHWNIMFRIIHAKLLLYSILDTHCSRLN